MNLAFRSVWNASLGAWVAAPEIARTRTRQGGAGGGAVALLCRHARLLAALILAYPLALSSAFAYTYVYPSGWVSSTSGTNTAVCMTAGDYSGSTPDAIFAWTCTGPGSAAGSVATVSFTGTLAQAMAFKPTMGAGATMMGSGTVSATGTKAVAVGADAIAASNGSVSIGDRATTGQIDNTYIPSGVGSVGTDAIAIGSGAKANAMNGIAIGQGAQVYQGWNYEPGTANPVANNYGIAIGTQATAINNNIVMGNVGAGNSLAAGSNTNPTNINNVTIGNGAGSGVTGRENIILGYQAATGMNSIGANVAIGKFAATNATFTSAVVLGQNAGNNATGNYNIAIGDGAGQNVTKGAGNPNNPPACGPAWGGYCPGGGQDGENNTAIGALAGNGVSGANNTTIGFKSGTNMTGMNNIAFGSDVARNTRGNANVWMGTQTAQGSVGSQNTAVGNFSGVSVYGNNNTALGNVAGNTVGSSAATSSNNTAVGNASGNTISGNGNAAFGAGSGSTVKGGNNASIGFTAGSSVTGSANFAGGNQAGNFVSGDWNVAIGRWAGQGASSTAPLVINRTVAIGSTASARSDDSIAMGSDAIAGTAAGNVNAIAIGKGAQATGKQSISIGTGNVVSGDNSGAIGDPSFNSGTGSYIVGNNNIVNSNGTYVIGSGVNNTAPGTSPATASLAYSTTAANSVYLGDNSTASTASGVGTANLTSTYGAGGTTTAGRTGTVASATVGGVTYGGFAGATSVGAVTVGAAGAERRVQNMAAGEISATSTDAINGSQLYSVIGSMAGGQAADTYFHTNTGTNAGTGNATTNLGKITDAAGATGDRAVTAGQNATAAGANAVSIGYGATTAVAGGVSLGSSSVASTGPGIAGYVPPQADTAQQTAIANTMGTQGAVSIGDAGNGVFRQITGVAAGTADSDAVNVAQLKAVSAAAAAAGAVHYYSVNDGGVQKANYNNDGATGVDALAAGVKTTATGASATAVGDSASAVGAGAVAMGKTATAHGNDSIALGTGAVAGAAGKTNAIAMGNGAQALGQSSISIGTGNVVTGNNSGAIGDPSYIDGDSSYAIGNNNNIAAGQTGVFVLGNDVTRTIDNSVALGAKSAMEANLTATTGGTTAITWESVSGEIKDNLAGSKPAGVVSVGDVGAERRIQNVASGLVAAGSTDATNGSQLFLVKQDIQEMGAKGLNFGDAGGNTVHKALGETLPIIGATTQAASVTALSTAAPVAGTYSSGNLQTYADTATGQVQIQMADSPKFGNVVINVDGSGKITGVAPGAIGPTSTDAVNGSQLYATNQYIDYVDGRVTQVDNRVTQVDNRVTQVAAIAKRGWDLSTNGGPATNIKPGGLVNIDQGSNVVITQQGGNVTVGMVDNPVFNGPVITNGGLNVSRYLTVQPGTIVNFSGNVIQNVGAGVNPGDAVNVQQLHDAENRSVQYARNPDGSVNYDSVPLRGDQYDPHTGQGGTTISNVAQGRNPSDAVNVQQLGNVAGELRGRINEVDRKASAGTASAMAMVGIPQAYLPGKSLVGAGIASYRGQSAIALGMSAVSDNGKWIVKGSLSRNSQGHTGVAVGAGFQW